MASATSAATRTDRARSFTVPEPRPPSRRELLQVHARRAQGRHEAEHSAARDRGEPGEREDREIDPGLPDPGDPGRRQREQGLDRGIRQYDPDHARRGRQHEALGQELTHDAPPPRPQRGPYGQLLRPARRASQEEVTHVGARDEQDEPDGAQEQPQLHLHVAHHHRLESLHHRRPPGTPFDGLLGPDPLGERENIRPRLLDRDAGLQATEHGQPVAVVVRETPLRSGAGGPMRARS